MIRRYSVPLGAVTFGMLCAVIDWRSRAGGGEMLLLSAAVILGLAILALGARTYEIHEKWRFEEYFAGDDTLLKMLSVIGGLLLAIGGISNIALSASGGEISLSILPPFVLGALAIASCVCCVMLTKAQASGEMNEESAASTLSLLVWATMHLIVTFKGNNTNPHMYTYFAGLAAAVTLTLAFLFYARFLYGKMMPRMFLFLASAATMLTFASAGGYALVTLLPGSANSFFLPHEFTYHISALGAAVYLIGQMIRMCAPRKQTYYWQD